MDLLKTRMMSDHNRHYSGPLDCLVKVLSLPFALVAAFPKKIAQTLRSEGPLALLKGWVPNYLRLGPHFIISLPLLEATRVFFGADSI